MHDASNGKTNTMEGLYDQSPYPQSSLISGIEFGPITTIGTMGDMWVTSWGMTQALYDILRRYGLRAPSRTAQHWLFRVEGTPPPKLG
jgi:hypothetical protein